jgi:hypothetical protein
MELPDNPAVSELRKTESHPAYALMNEAARILSGYGEGTDENDTDGEAAASEGRTVYVILKSGAELGPFEEFNGFGKHAVYGRHSSCRLEDGEAWGEIWSHVILYDQIAAFRVVYPS